jgi:adenylate cyclase
MSPRTAQRLRSAAPVVVLFVLVSIIWDFVSSLALPDIGGAEPFLAASIGVLLALPLILLESSAFAERFRRLSFPAAVLLKTVTYVGALALIFLGVGLLLGWAQGLTMQDFRDSLPMNFAAIGTSFLLYLVVIFLSQLNSLLGPGVLLRFVTGRYHQPRRERRIFMFVDIEDSTELSKSLSLEHYYGLVNDFFRDVAGPVLDSRGEIYEYVGDEVVISWKYEAGVRDANCVRAFFEIEKAVWKQSEQYLNRYGAVPAFKAGLHEGEVITAEMGGVKKVIAFNGEVLNTTARIQGECNRLGRRFLSSQQLVDQLTLPKDVTPKSVGTIDLRGIGGTDLVALA